MQNFFAKLNDSLHSITEQSMLKELIRLDDYLLEEAKNRSEKAVMYHQLKGLPYSEVAVRLGNNVNAVKGYYSLHSKRLYREIGSDFFTLVNDGDIWNVSIRIDSFTNHTSVNVLFPMSISNIMYEGIPIASYSPQDCTEEIKFLKGYSSFAVENSLKQLDKSKIVFLLNLLQGKVGTVHDRSNLYRIIKG